MEFWLNVVGLILSTIGALLLYFFGVAPLRVTATGEGVTTWVNSPTTGERERNKQVYSSHRRWSQTGLLLLIFGFLFQLIGALWPHLISPSIPTGDTPTTTVTPELMTAWATIALAVFTLILVITTRRAAAQEIEDRKNVTRLELTLRLTREYDSEPLTKVREKLAQHLASVGGPPDSWPADTLLDFFETMGHLAHRGLLDDDELLWNDFSMPVLCYWTALTTYVEKRRMQFRDEVVFGEAEWLYNFMQTQEQKRRQARGAAAMPPQTCETFFRAESPDS